MSFNKRRKDRQEFDYEVRHYKHVGNYDNRIRMNGKWFHVQGCKTVCGKDPKFICHCYTCLENHFVMNGNTEQLNKLYGSQGV
jgi:hypothetical protein